MPIKPSVADAMNRLRLDEDLRDDVMQAIEQAHAQAVAYLDGVLYETAEARAAASDRRGIICTPDIIAAQLLLADALVGSVGADDRKALRAAAYDMLFIHRNTVV